MSLSAWQRKPPDIYWTQGDTAPAISEQLLDGTGAPVNLSGGTTVRFQALFPDSASSAQAIDQAATIVTPASGLVSYTPVAADTDTIGDALVQWKVTFAGGAIEHFPNSGYQKLRISTKAG